MLLYRTIWFFAKISKICKYHQYPISIYVRALCYYTGQYGFFAKITKICKYHQYPISIYVTCLVLLYRTIWFYAKITKLCKYHQYPISIYVRALCYYTGQYGFLPRYPKYVNTINILYLFM